MLLFGGATLHYFALALTIGILFGIYSSVFVAASIAMWLGIQREDLVKGASSMATSPALTPRLQLARALRERFLAEAGKAALEISGAVQERLTTLMDELVNARESQSRRDTWMAYKRCRPLWVDGTMKVWRECLDPPKQKKAVGLEAAGLELVGTEV
eukprot:gene32727-55251_t